MTALNEGEGYVPGASASLGYCLGVCITVDGARRKRLLVFLLFWSPCRIFISLWTWWGVGLRTIAQHWGSSPGSWGLRILLSVLVPGSLSCQALSCVTSDRNRNRIGRWPTLKTEISTTVECAQIRVPVHSSVKVLYITADFRRWWSWRVEKPRSIFIRREQSYENKETSMSSGRIAYGMLS